MGDSAITPPKNQELIDPSWPSYAEMCRGNPPSQREIALGEKARTSSSTSTLLQRRPRSGEWRHDSYHQTRPCNSPATDGKATPPTG